MIWHVVVVAVDIPTPSLHELFIGHLLQMSVMEESRYYI